MQKLVTTLGKVFCTFINVLLFFLASLNGQEFTINLLWDQVQGSGWMCVSNLKCESVCIDSKIAHLGKNKKQKSDWVCLLFFFSIGSFFQNW